MKDLFADGKRASQALPASVAWWTSSGSSNFTASTGAATQSVSSLRTILGYFTGASETPVTLAEGSQLTFRFRFTATGFDDAAPAGPTFRAGLLRSVANPAATSGTGFTAVGSPTTAARVAGDFGSGNPASNVFSRYRGYVVQADWRSTAPSATTAFFRRDQEHPGLLNNALANTALTTTADAPAPLLTAVAYEEALTVARTAAGTTLTDRLVRADTGALLDEATATDEVALASNDFDAVALCFSKASASATYSITLQELEVRQGGAPVLLGPTVLDTPSAVTLAAGADLRLAVPVAGTGPFSYTWRRHTAVLGGVTQRELVLTDVGPSDADDYSLVVANAAGSAASAAIPVTITSPAADTFARWAYTRDLPRGQRRWSDDADGNGLPLLWEYALGREIPGAGPLPWRPAQLLTDSEGEPEAVFEIALPDSLPPDVVVRPVVSGDLADWTPAGESPGAIVELPSGLMRVRLPIGPNPRFLRFEAVLAPQP